MAEVTLLGTSGTMPFPDRHLASFIIRHNGSSVLIDSGEGTQIALKKCKYTFRRIDTILLTHFHADHTSGIPGLLLSMGNEGRTEPVVIVGPVGVEKVINSLRIIAPDLPFEIKFVEISEHGKTFRSGDFAITAFPVEHTVSCLGYRIEIPRIGKFDVEKAVQNNVPMNVWSALQKQAQVECGGFTYMQESVLGQPRRGISVCYVTDSRPTELITEMATDTDLFVCEGMFADKEKQDRAEEAGHMTFAEAAEMARKAQPQRLWLTHYSPSLHEPEQYLEETQKIFPKTQIGYDGMTETILFSE